MPEAFYWSSLRVTNIVDPPNSGRIGFVDTDAITLSDPRVFRWSVQTKVEDRTDRPRKGLQAGSTRSARCVR